MSNPDTPSKDELEVAESKNSLFDLLYDVVAQVIVSRIGTMVYHGCDRILSTVEKTAKWSLPRKRSMPSISAPPLVRPLPWMFFLPALIALRLVRWSLSILALLLGYPPIYPSTVVSFLQNKRRKLRALKYRGLKLQRIERAERAAQLANEQNSFSWLRRITLPFRYIICLRTVRPVSPIPQGRRPHHHHRQQHQRQADEPSTSRSQARDGTSAKKRNAQERDADDSELSFEEPSVRQLLERYASEEDDCTFLPSDTSSEFYSDASDADNSSQQTVHEAQISEPKEVSNESNGKAASNSKEPQAETNKPQQAEKAQGTKKSRKTKKPQNTEKSLDTEKPQEIKNSPEAEVPRKARQKSSLNVIENQDNAEENPAEQAVASTSAAASIRREPETGEEEKPAEPTQKPAAGENMRNESKPADEGELAKEHPLKHSSPKNDHEGSPKNQHQQDQQQQQPQQQEHEQPHRQQQQQHQQNNHHQNNHHQNNHQENNHHQQPEHHHPQQHHHQQQHHYHHQQQQQQHTLNGGGLGGRYHKRRPQNNPQNQ